MIDRPNMRNDSSVTHYDGDKQDETGVAAIVKAFIKNPSGAVQIIVFIGAMYGVYYAIQGEITDIRAAQVTNYEKLNNKLELLVNSDTEQRQKIEAMYTRGDTRYTSIIAKLSAHDVDIAKIVANLDFIVEQYKTDTPTHPRPGHFTPTPTQLLP